jgi:nucleoside-diphosphate-sugar epimerase
MRPLLDLARRGVAVRPGPHGQRLALLHVADLVRAVDACLTHGTECRQQAFAIDDGHPDGYDFEEIGDAVAGRPVREFGVPGWALGAVAATNVIAARLFGYAPMLTPGKVREVRQPRWVCDNSAFTRATGWRPEIDLAHGARALFR